MSNYKLVLTGPQDNVIFEAEVHRKLVELVPVEKLADWLMAEFRPWFDAVQQDAIQKRYIRND